MIRRRAGGNEGVSLASKIFYAAAIYGVPVLVAAVVLPALSGRPVAQPEMYYGFNATALAFQAVFVLIAQNPAGLRAFMLTGVAEKLAFAIPCTVLFLKGSLQPTLIPFALIDFVWAALFVLAFVRTVAAARRT